MYFFNRLLHCSDSEQPSTDADDEEDTDDEEVNLLVDAEAEEGSEEGSEETEDEEA